MNGSLFGETVILRQIAFAVFRNFGPAAWQNLPDRQKTKKVTKNLIAFFVLSAEREALEPIHSRNIIKLQITDNHTQFGIHSKSKSF